MRWLGRVPVSWWRVACVLAAIFALGMALMPLKLDGQQFEHADKLTHAFTFAVITTLALLGWRHRPLLVVVSLVMYGAGIEALQGLTTYRTASLVDIVADVFGIGLGMFLARWLRSRAFGDVTQASMLR